MSEKDIHDKAEAALTKTGDKKDLSAVYDELRNNKSAGENKQERQAFNEELKKHGFPDVVLIGSDKDGHLITYDAAKKEMQSRDANNFDKIVERRSLDAKETPERTAQHYDSKVNPTPEKNKDGDDKTTKETQKAPDDANHVSLPDGSQLVNDGKSWHHMKDGKDITEKGGAIKDVAKNSDGSVVIKHDGYTDTVSSDGTHVKTDGNGHIFEIWPKGNYDNRICINRDENKVVAFEKGQAIDSWPLDEKHAHMEVKDGKETGNVIFETSDGGHRTLHPDGTTVTVDKNSRVTEIVPRGEKEHSIKIERNDDGTAKKITEGDGTVVEVGADGMWHATNSKKGTDYPMKEPPKVDDDGTVHLNFDTRKDNIKPDGTHLNTDAQDRPTEIWPQGDYSKRTMIKRVPGNPDVIASIDFPNDGNVHLDPEKGTYVRVGKDGKTEELKGPPTVAADGTVTMEYPDGRKEVRSPDGNITVTDKDGKVIESRKAEARKEDKPSDDKKNDGNNSDGDEEAIGNSRKAKKKDGGGYEYETKARDTVWGVARDLVAKYYGEDAAQDPRKIARMVKYIAEHNHLKNNGNSIGVKQKIELPSKEEYEKPNEQKAA